MVALVVRQPVGCIVEGQYQMGREIGFRQFLAGDGIQCHGIRRTAIQTEFAGELPESALLAWANAFTPEAFDRFLGNLVTHVATSENRIVGFCAVRIMRRAYAEIVGLYVQPEARSGGIASRLLRYAEETLATEFPSVTTLIVATAVPKRSQHFWERRGFSTAGKTYYLYRDGTAQSIRLEKSLDREAVPTATK